MGGAKAIASEREGSVLEVLSLLLAEGRNDDVIAVVSKLVARNGELEERLAQLLSRKNRAEGISSAQLLLFLDAVATSPHEELNKANSELRAASAIDETAAAEEVMTRPAKQPPSRRPIPADLQRVDNPISVPADQRPCPKCGGARKCIGHDVTEVIDLVPARVIVRRDMREKLACESCERAVTRAPRGDTVVAGGRLGSTLVAQLLVDKYRDGLPLHRQKQRFERMGMSLPVSTLADQVGWGTDLLTPLWRASMAEVLTSQVMHLDATSLPVLDRDHPGGKRLGALWGYVGDDRTALYLYASTAKKKAQRPGEIGPEDFLKLRNGYTVADAANVFDESFKREGIIECGCNTHARRYFKKALERGDNRASLPLAAFKRMYKVEEEIRDLGADAKLAERQARSKPVFEELGRWCTTHQPHEPPASPMGAAIRYFLNQQVPLSRFLYDGVVPIDNSVVERLHVRAALTRKNFLFAGSDAGAHRAAVAYTILSSCALAEVNPVEYLADVLPRLARKIRLLDVPQLLPAAWKASRSAAAAAETG